MSLHRVLRALWSWLWLVVAILSRAFLVVVAALAAFATLPMVIGLTSALVQGVSMEPVISAGDVVLSRPYDLEDDIPLGRVVTFAAPAGSEQGGPRLHRIVAVAADGSLVTAGDGNAEVDSAHIRRADIDSVARLLVPWIGLPLLWLRSGDVVPLVGAGLVVGAAVAVEISGGFARQRHRSTGQPALPRHAIARASASVLLLVVAGGMPVSSAPAAFSATTSSTGNAWSATIPATAGRLIFSSSPSSSTGGVPFARQPVVTVQTASGKPWSGTRTVALTLTAAGGASLGCASHLVTSETGIIAFSGCAVNKPGTYTLTATSGALSVTSATFTVSVGPAAQLAFTATPGRTRAGAIAAVQPAVAILDAGGNRVSSTAAVSLSLTAPGTAKLSCTSNPRAAVVGVATFTGCRIDVPGTYTLTARSGALTPGMSAAIFVYGPAIAPLRCDSTIWMATYSWTPTPNAPTTYTLYVNGTSVRPTGADGWNSYVQLNLYNLPSGSPAAGSYYVEVRQVLTGGGEQVIGNGTVVIGPDSYRTYTCG